MDYNIYLGNCLNCHGLTKITEEQWSKGNWICKHCTYKYTAPIPTYAGARAETKINWTPVIKEYIGTIGWQSAPFVRLINTDNNKWYWYVTKDNQYIYSYLYRMDGYFNTIEDAKKDVEDYLNETRNAPN